MIILLLLLITILLLYFANRKSLMETKKLASDEELDKMTETLPNNEEICKEFLQMLNSDCKIELDNKTKTSAYIYFLNKIILSDIESSRKNFSRVLFISHECIHSVQDKVTHAINFALANIKNIYDIVLLILILIHKGSMELITVSLLISFLSFYFRIVLESDAVYRSVIYSRKYLEKRDLSIVADKYEEIVPKTIKGMYFSYLVPIILRHIVIMTLFLIV